MPAPLRTLSREQLALVRDQTVTHYEQRARSFWEGTRDHDVSQNIEALLRHAARPGPLDILDVGCGPGRDLLAFRERGHRPVGLDAAPSFVEMARAHAGCEVWRQDLLALELPAARFDAVFANAALFHVPSQELGRVLEALRETLRSGGVLFASNPRGPDVEELHGRRYGCYMTLETWSDHLRAAGFSRLEYYYRPSGLPRAQQPWLATVWRR